jgi:fatty-acyl-CoA synthase
MQVPLSPVRCLYRGVDLYGKNTGVVCGSKRFTYAEFGERCERLAAGLIAEGVGRGDRVAYLSFNTHQLLEGYFGVVLAGAIVMPLNVRLTAHELTGILNHAEPRILIYEADFAPVVQILQQACPSVNRWIDSGDAYEALLSAGRIERPDIMAIDENAIAELFYTSGSTGTPKGVALSHRTLYLHALSCAAIFPSMLESVELHTIPLFHARLGTRHSSTLNGVKQVMVRRFDPAAVLKLIEDEKATSMSLVLTMRPPC